MQLLPWQREDRDVAAGTLCDVAGWGVVTHAGRRPDRLQYLSLPVLGRATCNLRTYHDGTITERMMCAESHRRDTCKVRGRGGAIEGRGLRAGVARRRCRGLARVAHPPGGGAGPRSGQVGRRGGGCGRREPGAGPGAQRSRPAPTGRLRGPAGVRRRGRSRGHFGLARVRQPQEAWDLHARGELRGLDRRRAGRGRGRLRRPRGAVADTGIEQ